jgi:hypothetical protein
MIQQHLRLKRSLYPKQKFIRTMFNLYIYFQYLNIMDIEKHLFDETQPPKDKLKLYNFLHHIEDHGNYSSNLSQHINTELAEIISKKYHLMTPEEMKHIAMRCLSENDVRRILLNYELKNLHREQTDVKLEEFAKIAQRILSRYQCKAGGFYFGDSSWTIHTWTSEKYEIYVNEIVFENTLSSTSLHEHDTTEYLRDILVALNKISTRVKVTIHSKYVDRDKTYVMMIKCREFS